MNESLASDWNWKSVPLTPLIVPIWGVMFGGAPPGPPTKSAEGSVVLKGDGRGRVERELNHWRYEESGIERGDRDTDQGGASTRYRLDAGIIAGVEQVERQDDRIPVCVSREGEVARVRQGGVRLPCEDQGAHVEASPARLLATTAGL